jgi:hypothetical protein
VRVLAHFDDRFSHSRSPGEEIVSTPETSFSTESADPRRSTLF